MGPKTRLTAKIQANLSPLTSHIVQHQEFGLQKKKEQVLHRVQDNKESRRKQLDKTKSKKHTKGVQSKDIEEFVQPDIKSNPNLDLSNTEMDELVTISELCYETSIPEFCSEDELLGFSSDESMSSCSEDELIGFQTPENESTDNSVQFIYLSEIEKIEKDLSKSQCTETRVFQNSQESFLPITVEVPPVRCPMPEPCIVAVEVPDSVPEVITLDYPEEEEDCAMLRDDRKDDMQSCINMLSTDEVYTHTPYMDQLHAAMLSSKTQHPINVALTGPPGVGKTQLVLHYLQQHKHANVFWVDSSCQGSCTLMKKVYVTLSTRKDVVIVFDNADRPRSVSQLLPVRGTKPVSVHIIVTSQYTEWTCDSLLSLSCFTTEQSMSLLHSSLPDTDDICSLIKLTGNLPCALQDVIAYFTHKNRILQLGCKTYTVENFMHELATNPLPFFNFSSLKVRSHWQASLDRLADNNDDPLLENAFLILNLLSFVITDDIPVSIFKHVLKTEEVYLESLLVLKESSLIHHEDQSVMLMPMFKYFVQSHCTILQQVVDLVLNTCTRDSNSHYMIQQAMHTWQYTCEFPHLIVNYSQLFVLLITSTAVSMEAKLQFIEKHVASLELVLGWKHEHFLCIQAEHAYILFQLQKYQSCSDLCGEILKRDVLSCKNDSYYCIVTLKSQCLEKFEELEELFEFTISQYEKILAFCGAGDNTAQLLLKNICSMAFKLYHKHKTEQWTSRLFKLVQARASCKESSFEHTLEITQKIAQNLINCNYSHKALLVYDRLYNGCNNMSKTELALKTLYQKALCLYDMKELHQSWKLLSRVYQQQTKANLCAKATLLKMCEIACALGSQVLKTFISLLDTRIKDITQDFKQLLLSVKNIATILQKSGKTDEAASVFDSLYKTMLKQHGLSSNQLLLTLHIRADWLCEMCMLSQAWEIIKEILQIQCNPFVQQPKSQSEMKMLLSKISTELLASL